MSDYEDIYSVTEASIAQSDRARSERWKQIVLAAIWAIAKCQEQVLVEDVRDYLGPRFLGDSPHTLGPVMRRAAQEGWVEFRHEYTTSTLSNQHRRPVRVWQSLIYQQPEQS